MSLVSVCFRARGSLLAPLVRSCPISRNLSVTKDWSESLPATAIEIVILIAGGHDDNEDAGKTSEAFILL